MIEMSIDLEKYLNNLTRRMYSRTLQVIWAVTRKDGTSRRFSIY